MEDKHVGESSIPFLIFGNKMDKKNSLGVQDLAQRLNLNSLLRERPWHIIGSNALEGQGLEEGILWLIESLKYQKQNNKENTRTMSKK